MNAKIFDQVKKSNPDVLTRLEVVEGDITEEGFGIHEKVKE